MLHWRTPNKFWKSLSNVTWRQLIYIHSGSHLGFELSKSLTSNIRISIRSTKLTQEYDTLHDTLFIESILKENKLSE